MRVADCCFIQAKTDADFTTIDSEKEIPPAVGNPLEYKHHINVLTEIRQHICQACVLNFEL